MNCTQQAFIDFGSPCASADNAAAYSAGCLTYGTTNFLELYPSGIESSEFYKPVTKVAESGCAYNYNQSLPDCTPTVLTQVGYFQLLGTVPVAQRPAFLASQPFPVPGPYSENRAWADKQFNSPLPTYLGIDGRGTYSRSALGMMSFNFLLFSFALFPHWTTKAMSVKSDKEVRIVYSVLSFASVWSVFPMVLVGISGRALLGGIYPDVGSEFFAVIIDNMANIGGGPEYIAAIGAVAAIAAMMSTVDSALISLTNLVSTDFLRNWLLKNASDKIMLRVCKVISLVTIMGCVSIALYDKKLNSDDNVYATLIEWQSSLLWQILPATLLALYWNLNAWACVIGQICGIAAIIGLYIHRDSCHNWNSAYAWQEDSYVYNKVLSSSNYPEECDVNTYYLEYHVWAALINVFVTCLLSVVFNLVGVPNTASALEIPEVAARCGDDSELSLDMIHEIMDVEGTREPVKDPLAIVFVCIAALLTTFSLPWYGDAYDNCDVQSYQRWVACEIAEAPCKQMCDVADMSLAPPAADPVALLQAAACLTDASITCSCPLQGGWFTTSGINIPTEPVANVSYSGTLASLATGGSLVYDGTGDGKICEGYDLTNGIPTWALHILICWIVGMFCVLVGWMRWGCIDDWSKETTADSSVMMNPISEQGNGNQNAGSGKWGFKSTPL